MGSIGKTILGVMAEEIAQAEVVTPETVVMYDDVLLAELKCLTVEDLLVRLDNELSSIQVCGTGYTQSEYGQLVQGNKELLRNKDKIISYLCEVYRRNVNTALNAKVCSIWDLYDPIGTNWGGLVLKCFMEIKDSVNAELRRLRNIKRIQLACLKTHMMYKEINNLIDSILDKNGNKMSEFNDYLTQEHYRLVRSGVDVKDIPDPEALLASLRKMKNE
jgi:hypothetical protein